MAFVGPGAKAQDVAKSRVSALGSFVLVRKIRISMGWWRNGSAEWRSQECAATGAQAEMTTNNMTGHRRRAGARFAASLLAGVSLLCVLASGSLAQQGTAKAAPAAPEAAVEAEPATTVSKNSKECGFTLYSENDDQIAFGRSVASNCFDMLDGNDVLKLDRSSFRMDAIVHSGLGRDIVWTADGNDLVIDADAQDAEIRTYGGNDTIELRVQVEEDPARSIGTTFRTDIWPGPGENDIHIGQDVYSDAFVRRSPNAWIWSDPGARDTVKATCGRPAAGDVFDVRLMEIPENASVDLTASGCGIGVFGLFGGLSVEQTGGRVVMQTEGERFRRVYGNTLPVIAGRVQGSVGGYFNLTASDPSSDFTWEGDGPAVAHLRYKEGRSGGNFQFLSGSEVYLDALLSDATGAFALVSQGAVTASFTATSDVAGESFAMVAPKVEITWSYAGGAGFPEILTDMKARYVVTELEVPKIEFYQGSIVERAKAMFDMAMGKVASITAPNAETGSVNSSLPEGVANMVLVEKPITVQPGTVGLTLVLKQAPLRDAPCFDIKVIDLDGEAPALAASCVSPTEPPQFLKSDNIAMYDRIDISGTDRLTIDINGQSGFAVHRLGVWY
jgi:hypothetical protein